MAFRANLSFGYGLTPWVKRLLIANVVVFFALWLVDNPALTALLVFKPARLLFEPWTLVTYMFVHGSFWHLFFNMLALFFFGPPLEERWGSREFLKYYLICGLGGAALSFLFAWHSSIVGASAAVYGVMLAFAMNWPDAPIYIWGIFPIKAKWLVAIFVGLSLMSAVSGARDGVAHFAHLGGFAAGFLYLKLDWRLSHRFARWKKMLNRQRHRLTVIPGDRGKPRPTDTRARRREEERLLDEVDRVLDKISKAGLASLTAEERRLLDEVSRRYRQN
ncbi:MAG TPA: rhomboid family intramembrane serine protease [Longimicrobiales bacterium]